MSNGQQNQFAEADNRTSKLTDLNNQIDTLSNQLTDGESKQTKLQKQIKKAQTFLDENPLPANRQQRLTEATSLLTQLGLQEAQLETTLTTKVQHDKNVVSLRCKIKDMSKTCEKQILEKTAAETALENATTTWNTLLKNGAHTQWTDRKQRAVKAQPIAQKYETVRDDSVDTENQRDDLEDTLSLLETQLQQIESELAIQAEACQRAGEAVQRYEDKWESARWANPINQLRQHLHTGEPCLVCGATEHPSAGKVELEDDDRLQNAEDALKHAKNEAKTAQDQMQALKTKQTVMQRDKLNADNQIKECESHIEMLRSEKAKHLTAWQAIYPDEDVSSDWAAEQIASADTAIAVLGTAEKARTDASYAHDIVAQQLKTCETDIAREKESLKDVEKQLHDVNSVIANLQVDITSTEEQFWELLPMAFHGVAPDVAVDQFDKKNRGSRDAKR